MKTIRTPTLTAVLVALALSVQLLAQTAITPPKNKYSPQEDVQLGREAAAQVEQQLPILHNDEVTSYVRGIGERLVNAIPPNLRHSEFRYTFSVVNVREINAFALPGGPMYVNRGMIEAAHTEGEVAGVMAHELSHVALRHGTAQATAATKYEVGEIAGAVLGAIIGGRTGNVIAQGTQFGVGTAFLRFSRAYEKQADLEGAQIMARAGYDPREMANMFKTIEQQGGPGGPQWLSDHPNPGNRYDYITKEAQSLRVQNPVRDTREFQTVQAELGRLPKAPKTEDAMRTASNAGTGSRPTGRPVDASRIEPPSSSFRKYNAGDVFRVSVPSNWQQVGSGNAITFAPPGAYGTAQGQSVFTHGVEIGIARNETDDLETSTNELVQSLTQSNPRMSRAAGFDRGNISGRQALRTVLSNQSEVTGQPEQIELFTTQLRDGNLLYVIGVSPRDSFPEYDRVFRKVVGSIEIAK
jgi:Zn-dependent protease with chaperone function